MFKRVHSGLTRSTRAGSGVAVALAIGAGLVGCASVPDGDRKHDAMLKTFAAPPGQAGIYVVRRGVEAPAVPMDVDIDGVPLGRTGARTYLYRTVAPGRHTVSAHAENTARLDLDLAAGTLSFVGQDTTWGVWRPRTRLRLLGAAEGREAVQASRLARSLEPTQRIEVGLQADDPAWLGPLSCEASNPFGRWAFSAPGSVMVATARAPLQITCQAPVGAVAQATAAAPPTAADSARAGAASGAAAGAGLGLALGAATVQVAGPAMIVLLAVGGSMRGAEMAGAVAARMGDRLPSYPSPVVVHIQAVPRAQR
jgi:hypothetical protein